MRTLKVQGARIQDTSGNVLTFEEVNTLAKDNDFDTENFVARFEGAELSVDDHGAIFMITREQSGL
jgi:hypothetical protein